MMMGTVLLLKTCTYMDHDLNVAKVLEGLCLFVTCVNGDASLDLLDICVRTKAYIRQLQTRKQEEWGRLLHRPHLLSCSKLYI